MAEKPKKILIIGIDGGDPDLIFNKFRRKLPNISSLLSDGKSGILLSTIPSATIPAWNSFYTGLNPGGHNMFDFTTPPDYRYRIHFVSSLNRNVPAFWKLAGERDKKCAVLNFPSCYPPERVNGVMISGFDCPLPSGGDKSFLNPPYLYDEILKRFGPYRISGFDQINLKPSTMRQAGESLLQTAEYKGNVAEWLLKKDDWDLFMVHFGEVDAASHHFWRFYDKDSPRRLGNEENDLTNVIPNIYAKIDEQVGKLISSVNNDWSVLLMSDHGFRGAGKYVLHINNLLHNAGLLSFKRQRVLDDSKAKSILKMVPKRFRKYLFRGALAPITDRTEGMRRFGNIDFLRTKAFSDELNYFPSVRINLKGAYQQGIVASSDKEKVIRDVEAVLKDCHDPNGEPIVKSIHRREDIYSGKFVNSAPDVIIELNSPDGYTNGVLPSNPYGVSVRELSSEEYPGGKGSFPCGGHRREGFYILYNSPPSISPKKRIQIFDLTQIVYYIMNIDL